MNRRVRLVAWLLYRGPAILQILGMGVIAFGVGLLVGGPVGLIVAGIELLGVGVVLERQHAR